MATPAHCHYCFDVLASHLARQKPLSLSEIEELYNKQQCALQNPPTSSVVSGVNGHTTDGTANGTVNGTANGFTNGNGVHNGSYAVATSLSALPKMPLFVTWKIASKSGRLDLRGCIGTFDPKLLESGLKDYSLTAGLHDTRFSPISTRELPRLECGVTLLTDFEPADDAMHWEIGVHGLQIDFVYHGRRMGATYLPDVAAEQGWTKEETVVSLMRKAGWTGRKEDWRGVKLSVTRYRGSKATVAWEEYRALVDGEWDTAEEDEDDEERESE